MVNFSDPQSTPSAAAPAGPSATLPARAALVALSLLALAVAFVLALALPAAPLQAASPYAQWGNGPPTDPNWFPIGVWYQWSGRAASYKACNFTVMIAPDYYDSDLLTLKNNGLKAITTQSAAAINAVNANVIIGWFMMDEPDNAQWNDTTQRYDPPILPSVVINQYQILRTADPTRPVYLNLGQAVAWDAYIGRGTRSYHPEDYMITPPPPYPNVTGYLAGCDIGSFDIYPYATSTAASYATVKNKPYMVPTGVDRLIQWSNGQKVIWNYIECTNIHGYGVATPAQVKAEVWMSLVHGSTGITYFAHSWYPSFDEDAVMADPAMKAAVTAINAQVLSLAPALNSPTLAGATAASSNAAVPVDIMMKRVGNFYYLFAVGMRPGDTTATFTIPGYTAGAAEVIGEGRNLTVTGGSFQDTFSTYAVHLYKLPVPAPSLTTWETLVAHGPAGQLATTIINNYVEPRLAGLQKLRLTFDRPLDPASLTSAAITISGATVGDLSSLITGRSLDPGGTVLTVDLLAPLPEGEVCTITATTAIRSLDGLPLAAPVSLTVKLLAGDATGDGTVSLADLLALRAKFGQPVSAANARYDLNGSGVISAADLAAVRARLGHAVP